MSNVVAIRAPAADVFWILDSLPAPATTSTFSDYLKRSNSPRSCDRRWVHERHRARGDHLGMVHQPKPACQDARHTYKEDADAQSNEDDRGRLLSAQEIVRARECRQIHAHMDRVQVQEVHV